MRIDPAGLDARALYHLMISVVVPRPIAWVSTVGPDGVLNAAPFSYFQALSSRPPLVMISVGNRRDGTPKDTRRNIEASRDFVVNVVSESSAERMVASAADHASSEFDAAGLKAVASEKVRAPRIAECLVALECRLDRVLEVPGSGICIGEVVLFHLDDSILDGQGNADPAKLKPLGRLGGSLYAPLREILEIPGRGAGAARVVTAEDEELLALWRELRTRSAAIARALRGEHLARTLGDGGETVGRLLRHLVGTTAWLLLHLEGREGEDQHLAWEPSFTGERLARELEEDRDLFLAAMRAHLPAAREKLRRMIRHEAWHQGQIAAAVRDHFGDSEVWRLGG